MSNTAQKLDTKGIWVYDSDVNVALLLIVEHYLLRFRNVYFGVSAEKTNIGSLLEFLGSERAKCLFTFHYLTGCDTVVKFHISKEARTKLFLQLNDQDIFKAFESLQEEVMPKIIDDLPKFNGWYYITRANTKTSQLYQKYK